MNSNTQKVEGKTENIGEIFTLNFQAKNLVEFAHLRIRTFQRYLSPILFRTSAT